jgi:hypothetical protein
MFTKTRAMCVFAGSALLAGLSGAVGAPAQAASGSLSNVPWAASDPDDGQSILPSQIHAGDCTLLSAADVGVKSARVEMRPESLGSNPSYWIQWDSASFTTTTQFGDTWHQTFVFRNANGTELFRWTADSPEMFNWNQYYYGEAKTLLHVSPNLVRSIARVDWDGDC